MSLTTTARPSQVRTRETSLSHLAPPGAEDRSALPADPVGTAAPLGAQRGEPAPHGEPDPASRDGWTELGSAAQLRELLGTPFPIVLDKVKARLNDEDRRVLPRSPFCVVSSSDADGGCDASPRGDAPGFVRPLDAGTVAIPDRPGNRRADGFHNILGNPHVGLLHLVPGSADVLRIKGRARIVTDAPFFDDMVVRGLGPSLALVVEIDEVYPHCPQSLRRAGIWQPETWPEPLPRR